MKRLRLGRAQLRKSVADVTRRPASSLTVLLAIAIPVTGFVGAAVAGRSLSADYSYTLQSEAARQDVVLALDHGNGNGRLDTAIAAQPNIAAIQPSSVLDTQWHVAAAPGHVAMTIVGAARPGQLPLTPYQLLTGHDPTPGGIVLEYGDLGLQPVKVGDQITVDTAHGPASLRVDGLARTRGINPATSGVAVGYVTTSTLGTLPAYRYTPGPIQRQPLRTDQVTLRLRDPAAYQATIAALGPLLQAHHATLLSVLPPGSSAPLRQLQGLLRMVGYLLLVATVIGLALIASSISALLTAEASAVATLKALGATRARVIAGYVLSLALIALPATALGIAAGIAAGVQLSAMMARSIPLAAGPALIPANTIALGVVVGVAGPLLAALPALRAGTGVPVARALSGWGLTTGIRRPGRPARWRPRHTARQTIWLGVRALTRRPWTAAVSVLTVATAAAAFLVVTSLASSINASVASVWSTLHADVEVYAGGDHSMPQLLSLLRPVPNIARVERVGWYGTQTPWGKAGVWGLPPGRDQSPPVVAGRQLRPGDDYVCLISTDFAARSHLRVGSIVNVSGPGGTRTQRFTVAGIASQTVDDISQVGSIDMPVNNLYQLEGAPSAGIENYTSRVLIQARDRSPQAVATLTRQIDALGRQAAASGRDGPIAEVFTFHDEVVRHQRNFEPIDALLLVVALLIVAVGTLGLADSLTAAVLQQRRDIGILRALGAQRRHLATVLAAQTAALTGLGWLVATGIGVPLASWFVTAFRNAVMPTHFRLDAIPVTATIGLSILMGTLAVLLPARHAARVHPSELLRSD